MNENKSPEFNTGKISSIHLNLLDGQVNILLDALKLYGYNLEYMLNTYDMDDEEKAEKIGLLKYTYEQILASRAEQKNSAKKGNQFDSFDKVLSQFGLNGNRSNKVSFM